MGKDAILHKQYPQVGLRPVEWFTMAFLAVGALITDLYGRPFYFVLERTLNDAAIQINWITPCLVLHYLFALYRTRPKIARCVHVSYFFMLISICIGSSVSTWLTDLSVMDSASDVVFAYAFKFAALLVVMAAGLTLAVRRRDREHADAVLKKELGSFLLIGRLFISLVVCFAVYSNLKAMIPTLRPGVNYDSFLYSLDRALFLGNDPYVWIQNHSNTWFDDLMERSYFFYFFFTVFGLGGSYIFGSIEWFERTITAFIVSYMVGMVGYFLVPALGPAFFRETGAMLEATLDYPLKQYILGHYLDYASSPKTAMIVRFNGLAAFPSLHCANAVLFMYFLGKKEIWMPVLLFIPLVLLMISTVWLGWHWAVDLIGGLAVTCVAIRISTRLLPNEQPAPVDETA